MKTVTCTLVLSALALCMAPETSGAQEVIQWTNESGWRVGDTRPDTSAAGLTLRLSIASSTNSGQVRAVLKACNNTSIDWRGAAKFDENTRPTSSGGPLRVRANSCTEKKEHIDASSRILYLWIKRREN